MTSLDFLGSPFRNIRFMGASFAHEESKSPAHSIFLTPGIFQVPSMIERFFSGGRYRRIMRMNLSFGTGSAELIRLFRLTQG